MQVAFFDIQAVVAVEGAERLAVIGHQQHHERTLGRQLIQLAEQWPKLLIEVADLVIVAPGDVAAVVGGGPMSGGGCVGAEEVNPLEERAALGVEFVGCNLSGAVLEDATLTRVAFTGCRLTGVVLSGAQLRDVRITEGRADLALLRMAKARHLWVVQHRSCGSGDRRWAPRNAWKRC